MTLSSYGERDYLFGQTMLTLRTSIGLTQAGLAELLGISRNALAKWEAGDSYPKAEHLKVLLTFAAQQRAFPAGREEEEIRAFWRLARQRVLLDEAWLRDLLTPPASAGHFPQESPPVAQVEMEPVPSLRMDWIGALDVSHFVGREVEVAELTRWIVQDRCRLITVLGMGGIGKSMLVSFLGQHLASQFEAVLWRSVRDAPSCEDLVADCMTFFSETPPASFPSSFEQCLNQLLACLQSRRCLLVLDNLETLLTSGDSEGSYLPGYEGYGRLIQRLAESAHRSCVLLTSREKPKEIEPLEGARSPVRSLGLVGVDSQAAQELLSDKGLNGTPIAWQQLVASYAGNPLALKVVAQAISDLFNGAIEQFLQDGELIFNGIRAVLRQQVGRLTPLEHLLLTWFAVLREWTPLDTLAQVLHTKAPRAQMLEALEALGRRSLLERGQQASFSLQSVVMEYLIDELIERLSKEILQESPQQIHRIALEQAQAKDYLRQTQIRLLVQPVIQRLRFELGGEAQVEVHLLRLLEQFRSEDVGAQGYGPANVISLLKALRGNLRGLNLSHLSIRGAYLQEIEMQDVSLAGAILRDVTFTEAFDQVLAVAVSPDGRYIAAGSNSGQIRIWREEGRVAHLTIQGHTSRLSAIAFSPDGATLASAGLDGTVRLWDLASGAAIWTSQNYSMVTSMIMASNGKVISGNQDGMLRTWDLKTGTNLSNLQTLGGPIRAIACSADGRWLASSTVDFPVVQVWDADQGILLQELRGHHDMVPALAFAPEIPLLASGSVDLTIKLWEVEKGTCQMTLEGHTGVVSGLAWAPDGRTLASTGHDSTIRLWDSQSWQCRHILQGHRDAITSLAFLSGGDRLLSGGYDRTIRTWDVLSGEHLRTMYGYALALYALAWSPDGHFLLSSSSEGTLMLWDVTTRTLVRILHGHQAVVFAVAWSRARKHLASGCADQTVRIWDAQTGACTHILQGHTGLIFRIAWSPDSSLLASGSYDRSVRLWDLQTGTSQVEVEHTGLVSAVVWSPDGTLLASSSEDGQILIWRARDGEILQCFEQAGVVEALCWSPNGEQLAIAGMNKEKGMVSLRDVRQGGLLGVLEGHRGVIMDLDWSSEHNILLSAGSDGTVRWWNPEQGRNLAIVQAHDAWVRAARVSPDGKVVASCGEDGVIKLWEMQSHQHLATLRADRPYERLDINKTEGLTHAQQAALQALGAVGGE